MTTSPAPGSALPGQARTHAGPASAAARVAHQGAYEILAMLKNGEQLMLLILFPLMALVGLSTTGFLDEWAGQLGMGRTDVAMPGILALCAISTALSGQGIATGFDRRYGVLRFLSTTPLGRGGLVAGKAVAVLGVLAVQYAVMAAAGLVLGWHPHLGAILASLPTLVLGASAFTALGLLVAGTIRAEATLAVVNTLWVLLATVGGTLVPVHHFPGAGAGSWLLDLLPSAALGSALRAEMLQGAFAVGPHAILVVWLVVAGLAARRFFRWS